MTEQKGPPPDSEVPAPAGTGTHHDPTVDTPDTSRSGRPRTFTRPATPKLLPRICPTDVAGQLRARRGASQRMVSLDCGCPTGPHSDPLSCLCTFPPLTEHQLDGWANTARDLLRLPDVVPLLPIEVLRALYRRGGADRALAERLHRLTGGVVR